MRVDIKPLTVNQVWQGRRFKTQAYKSYEKATMLLLPSIAGIPDDNICLTITAGFSNKMSDIDNIAKPFIDILQKKYNFNDNRIYKLVLIKDIVKKGCEYIEFEFSEL